MTVFQIVSLGALVCAIVGTYGIPKIPKSSNLLAHIAAVVRVRDAYADPDVTAACNSVLAALLKVKG